MAFSAAGKLRYRRASKRRVSAGTRYLVAVCCISFATSVAAEMSALSGDAIKAAVTGAVVEVDTPLGTKVPIRYSEDGRITGEARGLAHILGSPSDSGKWWVSGNRLCHKWTKWFDGVLQCLRISQRGSRIFWRSDDGQTGTAVISTLPTPPRLVASAAGRPGSTRSRRTGIIVDTDNHSATTRRARNGACRQPSHDGFHECRSPLEECASPGEESRGSSTTNWSSEYSASNRCSEGSAVSRTRSCRSNPRRRSCSEFGA